MAQLKIRQDNCELDFLSLGALVHRLDPGTIPFRKARSFEVHVSGGEYNVAANLSDCFGLKTGVATAMVNYGVGEIVQRGVREMGVKPFYKWFEHDGVRGPNIATVYSDRGHGVRPPVVFYNRCNEAVRCSSPATSIGPQFSRWCPLVPFWRHFCGTFSHHIATDCGRHAGSSKLGAITSFDLNYRAKLWKTIGSEEKGQEMCRKIAAHCDVLIGNEEDLQKGLGIKGQDVESKSKLDPEQFFGMIDNVIEKFPNVKLVATTLREVHSTNRHDWAAVIWYDGKRYVSPTAKLDVVCRIGGGDGFAAGLIYGMLAGKEPEQALKLGWAHGALLTTFTGDVTMAKLPEVEALAAGGSARVQR